MRKKIAIVGGGSCALILAAELDSSKYEISIYEKNAALGRKFLVAGGGGLNLTHSESSEKFIKRYTPHAFLVGAINHFSNRDFVEWLSNIGLKTFVGSSGRVFPKKEIKPVQVLNLLLKKIKNNNVSIYTKHEWIGFSENNSLLFNQNRKITTDYTIFCLGGGSWPVTGSNSDWLKIFKNNNIACKEFEASNCAYEINWSPELIAKIEGKALKNIAITCSDKKNQGEIIITTSGIEGSGIYPLSPIIRSQLHTQGFAKIIIDLKPTHSFENLVEKINICHRKKSFTTSLTQQLNLSNTSVLLLKNTLSKSAFLNSQNLATAIKNFELVIHRAAPVEEAISTVGGIELDEITSNFELKKIKETFVIGEMLDYDAPTGGYLLQSCFSMGKFLANYFNIDLKKI